MHYRHDSCISAMTHLFFERQESFMSYTTHSSALFADQKRECAITFYSWTNQFFLTMMFAGNKKGVWDMAHMGAGRLPARVSWWMIHVTHMWLSYVTHDNLSCHKYESHSKWLVGFQHPRKRPKKNDVTNTHASRPRYESVTSHVRMRHVTYIEWVMYGRPCLLRLFHDSERGCTGRKRHTKGHDENSCPKIELFPKTLYQYKQENPNSIECAASQQRRGDRKCTASRQSISENAQHCGDRACRRVGARVWHPHSPTWSSDGSMWAGQHSGWCRRQHVAPHSDFAGSSTTVEGGAQARQTDDCLSCAGGQITQWMIPRPMRSMA